MRAFSALSISDANQLSMRITDIGGFFRFLERFICQNCVQSASRQPGKVAVTYNVTEKNEEWGDIRQTKEGKQDRKRDVANHDHAHSTILAHFTPGPKPNFSVAVVDDKIGRHQSRLNACIVDLFVSYLSHSPKAKRLSRQTLDFPWKERNQTALLYQ